MWGGPGAAAGQFNVPDGMSVDAMGHVYVADRANYRIQKFSSTGRLLAVWGGVPGNGLGDLSTPYGVAADDYGFVYVADTSNNRIVKFTAAGRFVDEWGAAGGTGPKGSKNGEFNEPRGVAVDDRGNVYVADHNNNRVQKLSPDGRFLARFGAHGGDGTAGSGDGEFDTPRGVAVDHEGNIFVAEKGNNRIQELDRNGRFIRKWGASGGDGTPGTDRGQFRLPYNVAIDPDGHLWVNDVLNNRVQEFSHTGRYLAAYGRNGGDGSPGVAPGEFDEPYGVATDCRGNVYVSEEGNNRVQKLGLAGRPAPRCPPVLTARVAVVRRGTVTATVRCDRPCAARVSVAATGAASAHGAQRQVIPGAAERLRVRLPSSMAGASAAVTVTARGFAGPARAVHRRVRLAR